MPDKLRLILRAIYAKTTSAPPERAVMPVQAPSSSYEERVAEEKRHYLKEYADRAPDEPLFERAPRSWAYIEELTQELIRQQVGYSQWEYVVHQANQIEQPQMLSLGSGPCAVEMDLAEQIATNYHYHCLDLNEQILEIGRRQIQRRGLKMTVEAADLNFIKLDSEKYDIITAFSALHHLDKLEKVYAAVNNGLKPDGIFATVDVITRNGLMMWPKTEAVIQHLWSVWPDKFKINHTASTTPVFTPEFKNIDYGAVSFEAIRSQDLLPLIPEFFDPIVYVPYHSITRHFLDHRYGPNYNMNESFDSTLVKFIWNLDCYYVRDRILRPEVMFAVMRKKGTAESQIVSEVAGRMRADSESRLSRMVRHSIM